MTIPNRTTTALLVVTVLALLASACGSQRDELVIYSGRTENLVGPLLERFSEETGIEIGVRYGDSADLALLLDEEGDNTEADVFLAQSPGAVAFLSQGDALATLDQEVRDLVDPRFESSSGRWIGVSGRQRVLVYNTEMVEEADLPASVFDLTGEDFRGQVAVAPTNGSFQDFVSAMRESVGDEDTLGWLEGLAANDARTYANNNAIVDAVSRGEVPMGLVNHYYNYRFLDENPDLPSANYLFPDGDLGALVIVSSVSVLAASDHPDEASQFIEFLLSESSQDYFRDETFEYPLRAGIAADAELPSLTDQELPEVDFDALGADLKTTTELIARSGLRN